MRKIEPEYTDASLGQSQEFSLLLEAGPMVATIFVFMAVPFCGDPLGLHTREKTSLKRPDRINHLDFPRYCQGILPIERAICG